MLVDCELGATVIVFTTAAAGSGITVETVEFTLRNAASSASARSARAVSAVSAPA